MRVGIRASVSAVVIPLALAGSLGGAAAQSYPPPPQSYTSAPVPPLDVGEQLAEPSYGPGYDEQARENPPGPYFPASHPYFAPDRAAAPALQSAGGESIPRPPADVSGDAAPADYTGSVRTPATMGASPAPGRPTVIAGLPPEDQPEGGAPQQLSPQFRRQLVGYITPEPAGTVIIDTPHTYLYLVLGGGKALRYGIGVGREGFTWTGTERISRMSEWPDWHPPKEMIERQPYLPRFMAGGEGNPLGARALYLGNTLYRIHGTNQPSTIGHFVSSGCIRLTNEDVADLYSRVNVGTRIVVLSGSPALSASVPGAVAR